MATITAPTPGVLRRPSAHYGLASWIFTVDAKKIGVMYGVTSLIFMIGGGLAALMMRLQLVKANNTLVDPATFNTLFTMHGTVMVFLVIMPLNAAFFNYLLPLMLGARDVAFPRLNALSYWLFLFGGLFLYASFLTQPPDAGWFSYANLTEKPYSASHGIDYWIFSLQILGVASMLSSFNFIVTIVNMRAKGMSFMRMPIFVWMTLVTAFLIILAFPIITVALIFLTFDRVVGTHYFLSTGGGDPLLWQHLFWLFGHPEVYILILPPMGIVSEIVPVFSRKPLFGYKAMVLAGVFIGVVSFGVWSHHMFATGMGPAVNSYFASATFLVAVPTGVKIFNWLATLWGGQISFKTPMLFALAFIALFTIGGISGVMHASPPSDLQQTDTYFVVAHFHYVLFGGSIFGIFGGIYFWFPKITGQMLSESIGKINFWLMFIGFNLTFFPMHFVGMWGQPRRTYTYSPEMGFDFLNALETIGAFIMAFSFFFFAYNVWKSMRSGQKAGNDPWDAATLEWTIPSPPPEHNFDEIPEVRSARPLWDTKYPEHAENPMPAHAEHKEHGHHHIELPAPSYWPIVLAAGFPIAAFGLLYSQEWMIGLGLATVLASIYGWVKEPVFATEKE